MANLSVVPYLFFKGNCREAMEFYKDAFGGKLTVQTMAESGPEMQMPEMKSTDVMHARLVGPVMLMASDSPKASAKSAKIELAINGPSADETEMRTMFDKLAEGGEVTMKLEKMPWGDIYGQLTDKYGIQWMFDIGDSLKDSQS